MNRSLLFAGGFITVIAGSPAHAQLCTIDTLLSGELGEAISGIRRSVDASVCNSSSQALLRTVGILSQEVALLSDGWWVSGFQCRDGQQRAVIRVPNGWFGSRYVVYPERINTDSDYRELYFFRH
jgi:hypothetical protein